MKPVALKNTTQQRVATWIGFSLGLATMTAQFFIDLSLQTAAGDNFGQFLVYFFGFLTNLSNIWLVFIYAAFLFSTASLTPWFSKKLKIFQDARLIVAALSMMLIVTLVYHFILLPDLGPATGWDAYTDPIKHYVATSLFLFWWLLHVPRGTIGFSDLPIMILPALGYLIYVFVRGTLINAYPYSVIDVTILGYGPALAYAAGVIASFLVICVLLVLIDKAVTLLPIQVPKNNS